MKLLGTHIWEKTYLGRKEHIHIHVKGFWGLQQWVIVCLFVIADLFLEVPYDNGCLCKEENQVGQDSIVILEKEEVDVVVDKEQVQHKHQKCLEEPVLGEEDLQFVSLEIYGTGEGEIEGIVDGAEDQND